MQVAKALGISLKFINFFAAVSNDSEYHHHQRKN